VQVPSIRAMGAPVAILPFTMSVIAQLLVGIAIGFVARTIFFAVQTAGGIVSLQIGLSIAAVLNPLTNEADPILGQLYTIMVGMTFLALNGDAYLVASVARSFDLAPLSTSALSPNLMQSAAGDVLTVAELGLQIAMPIAATLFASDLLLGVVSRALPQLNVFVLSLPLNIILGLMAIIGSLAATVLFLGNQVSDMPSMLLALVRHV